jgi:hypothetical protein
VGQVAPACDDGGGTHGSELASANVTALGKRTVINTTVMLIKPLLIIDRILDITYLLLLGSMCSVVIMDCPGGRTPKSSSPRLSTLHLN